MERHTSATVETADALLSGLQVIGAEGSPLGTLEGVLLNTITGQPGAISVKHGRVLHKHKLIPASEIQELHEDRVILAFDAKEFRLLPNIEDDRERSTPLS